MALSERGADGWRMGAVEGAKADSLMLLLQYPGRKLLFLGEEECLNLFRSSMNQPNSCHTIGADARRSTMTVADFDGRGVFRSVFEVD